MMLFYSTSFLPTVGSADKLLYHVVGIARRAIETGCFVEGHNESECNRYSIFSRSEDMSLTKAYAVYIRTPFIF